MDDVRGDFAVYYYEGNRFGEIRPVYTGTVSMPGSDERYPVILRGFTWKDPQTGQDTLRFDGVIGEFPVDSGAASPMELPAVPDHEEGPAGGNLTPGPGRIILLFNWSMTGDRPGPDCPGYRGLANFGEGYPVCEVRAGSGTTR